MTRSKPLAQKSAAFTKIKERDDHSLLLAKTITLSNKLSFNLYRFCGGPFFSDSVVSYYIILNQNRVYFRDSLTCLKLQIFETHIIQIIQTNKLSIHFKFITLINFQFIRRKDSNKINK